MTLLMAAAVSFAVIHLLVSGTAARGWLVSRFGLRNYTIAFSAASAALLGWLIWAYAQVRAPQVTPWFEFRWVAGVLVLLAFLFIVLGLMTPGPTIVGAEKLLDREDPARGIHRVTRHPFLWGTVLWAATHVAFNREAAHVWFFGAFVVVALAGTVSIDAKRAHAHGERWSRYAAITSNVPFAAILRGRNRFAWREFGPVPLGIALAAFAAFALLHARFFGVAAL